MSHPLSSCRTCSGIQRAAGAALNQGVLRLAESWTPEQVRGDGTGRSA